MSKAEDETRPACHSSRRNQFCTTSLGNNAHGCRPSRTRQKETITDANAVLPPVAERRLIRAETTITIWAHRTSDIVGFLWSKYIRLHTIRVTAEGDWWPISTSIAFKGNKRTYETI